jgi:hypothetical protein
MITGKRMYMEKLKSICKFHIELFEYTKGKEDTIVQVSGIMY